MRLAFIIAAHLALSIPAFADTSPQTQLAISTNAPFVWPHSVSGSVAVGFKSHHAIRANVARYDNTGAFGSLIDDVFFDGDGTDAISSGRNLDVGVGYMWFPRSLFDGVFLEAGVLVRDRYQDFMADNAASYQVITDTMSFAGRAHVGWSWRLTDHVFVQAAVGVSLGHESGTETSIPVSHLDQPPRMAETSDVSQSTMTPEGFLRIGGAFDIE